VWRCNTNIPWSRRSLRELISLVARTRGGATLEVQPTRGASLSISATIPIVANPLTRVLWEEVLRGFGLFLSPGWGWCVSIVVMRIAVQSAYDTPVSPRVSLKMPNQEPLFYVNQSKHEHQINLSNKEFTKYILKSIMIKTIESFKKVRMCNPNKNPK
jgi:hypothetical protein